MDQGRLAYFREPVLWAVIAFLSLGLFFVAARQIAVMERLSAMQENSERYSLELKELETRLHTVEVQHSSWPKDVK